MAAITVIWSAVDRTSPSMRKEVINATIVNNADDYTSAEIGTIVGAHVSPNYAMAAADSVGVTFAANVATFSLVAGAANQVYTITLYGFN